VVLASPKLVLRLSLAGALTRRLRRFLLLFVFVILLLFVVLLLRFRLFFFLVVIFLTFLLVRLHGGNNSFRGALLAGGRGVPVRLGRLRLLLTVGRKKSLFSVGCRKESLKTGCRKERLKTGKNWIYDYQICQAVCSKVKGSRMKNRERNDG